MKLDHINQQITPEESAEMAIYEEQEKLLELNNCQIETAENMEKYKNY